MGQAKAECEARMSKTIGIVISTFGARSLGRTLNSILYQKEGIEDVLVVGNGFNEPTKELVEFYSTLGLPCHYQATVRTRTWGHDQVNYGLRNVRGDYVTYQDHDDIYLPRSLEEMVRLVNEQRTPIPIIGRVVTPKFGLLWQRPNATSPLDGHCLVAPNDKKRLGWMAPVHHGDQCYLNTTLRNYSEWAWTDRIWTLTRPTHWPMDVYDCHHGEENWTWQFYRDADGDPRATLRMDKDIDHDRMFARLKQRRHNITHDELVQIAQFAVYACQGNDCWFKLDNPDDALLIGALVETNYKEHTPTEYTHGWPADFWDPVPEGLQIINAETAEQLDDYRDDVWA